MNSTGRRRQKAFRRARSRAEGSGWLGIAVVTSAFGLGPRRIQAGYIPLQSNCPNNSVPLPGAGSVSWFEAGFASQLLPKGPLFFADLLRDLHAHHNQQIASPASTHGQAMPTHTKALPTLRARWDFDTDTPIERRH